MTGYELTEKLRKVRRRYRLNTSEQALYYELVAICNNEEWVSKFSCSNQHLRESLCITENTLISARNTLIEVGLITYKSGQSKRIFGVYSFNTTANFEPQNKTTTSKKTVKSEPQKPIWGSENDVKIADYIEDKQNQTKTKHSVSNETAPIKKKSEKKKIEKAPAAAKSGITPKEGITPHWPAMVKTWFNFYKSKYIIEPTFTGREPKALKAIIGKLQKLFEERKFEWTKELAIDKFTNFLTTAQADGWLSRNFILNNLDLQYDAILQKIINGKQGLNNQGKPATGSAVSTASAIAKINSMYSATGGGGQQNSS